MKGPTRHIRDLFFIALAILPVTALLTAVVLGVSAPLAVAAEIVATPISRTAVSDPGNIARLCLSIPATEGLRAGGATGTDLDLRERFYGFVPSGTRQRVVS
jgi:hypothetical protein